MIYHNITENEKKIICNWKYDNEYAIYNVESYEYLRMNNSFFCKKENEKEFYCFYNVETLIGMTRIHYINNYCQIGIAINPSFLNQGYGKTLMKETINIVNDLYHDIDIYLIVQTWNQRAISCYKKIGFEIIKLVKNENKVEYYNMKYKGDRND